mgnify:CR=1 FL=1
MCFVTFWTGLTYRNCSRKRSHRFVIDHLSVMLMIVIRIDTYSKYCIVQIWHVALTSQEYIKQKKGTLLAAGTAVTKGKTPVPVCSPKLSSVGQG